MRWFFFFPPPPRRSTGHWFTDMPSVAACIWLAWKKSERSLIPSREEKTGFKVVYLLPVTEDVRWKWSDAGRGTPADVKDEACVLKWVFCAWPWSSQEVDLYITLPVCTEKLPEVLEAFSLPVFSLVKLLQFLCFLQLWFLWIWIYFISQLFSILRYLTP